MRKLSMLLTVVGVLFVAEAISQEIVIEPTNGRAQSATRASNPVSRPASIEAAPAKPAKFAAKPAIQESSTAKRPTKKSSLKPVVAKAKISPAETKSVPAESVKNEAPAVAPTTKKVPARPEWAITDTRDARTLQVEIANALAHDPKLVDSSIQVNVDDGGVTLAGRAAGTEEHLQAQRLAQSYAWNRKLVDRIEIVRSVSAQK
jgi:hypothetical protein